MVGFIANKVLANAWMRKNARRLGRVVRLMALVHSQLEKNTRLGGREK
jgi:hypothetical protein